METEKSKRERFLKVAEARTNKIISMIRLLGNCSNTNNYSYTDSEVKEIFDAIEAEIKNAKSKYVRNNEKKFSFGGNKK